MSNHSSESFCGSTVIQKAFVLVFRIKMSSSKVLARKMYKLLEKTSFQMQEVVSREMKTLSVDCGSQFPENTPSYLPLSPEGDESLSKTCEVDIQDDLLDAMEFIVTCRQQVFALLLDISDDDPRFGNFRICPSIYCFC